MNRHDQNINLECTTPALDRLILLIEKMVEFARNNTPLTFPAQRLITPIDYARPVDLDFSALFPEHPVYQSTDVNDLQRRLAAADKEIKKLSGRLEQRTLGYWFNVGMRKLAKAIKRI